MIKVCDGRPLSDAFMGIFFACCISLPTTRLSVTSGIWTRPSMLTRKPPILKCFTQYSAGYALEVASTANYNPVSYAAISASSSWHSRRSFLHFVCRGCLCAGEFLLHLRCTVVF